MKIGSILEHHYRVVELIGSGGMAHVYRAVSIATGRSVAVKELREEYKDDPEFLRRFEQEAKAVLKLSQENIVRAYGVGDFDGMPYIIMEYVQGRTLKSVITANGPMPQKTAISITCQVLQALHAAHSAGFIHRDVKPHNVILTRDGRAKLTDFGIARDTNQTTRTFASDKVIGSVQYISPEQAQGLSVTASSDIYSVGIMLYEMLTGKVPFDGDTAVSIALRHVSDTPAEPRTINPQISPALNSIVMHTLEKDPQKRYLTARAMRADLLKAERDPSGDDLSFNQTAKEAKESVQPDTDTTPVKKEKPHRKGLKTSIISAVLVVAAICAIIGTFLGVRYWLSAGGVKTQSIPLLVNKTQEEAEAKAKDYGFTLTIEGNDFSDTVPAGSVIEQDPPVGTKAKQGSAISVVVSLGSETVLIPDLSGMTVDEAKAALSGVGMELGSVTYRISDVAIGYICGQEPAAGEDAVAGSSVDICISATAAQTIDLPNLSGETTADALSILSEYGFENVRLRYSQDSHPEGTVISQLPEAGEVASGAKIILTISGDGTDVNSADFALNIPSAENGDSVTVYLDDTINGFTVERLAYEATLEKGENISVSLTVYAAQEGKHELHVVLPSGEKVYEIELKP